MVFPLIILVILIQVFGGMTEVAESVVLDISIVNQTNTDLSHESTGFSHVISKVVSDISAEDASWLRLHQAEKGQSPEEFLAQELKNLEMGRRHAVIVIPNTIDKDVYQKVMSYYMPLAPQSEPGELIVYSNPVNQMSAIAEDIITQIVYELNMQMNFDAELADPANTVELKRNYVEPANGVGRTFSMADYLVPGIMLFAFLGSGLELVVERLTLARERGVLRRIFATPLRAIQYCTGLILHIALFSFVQVVLIHYFARYVFGVDIATFTLVPLCYLAFALLTFLCVGLAIVALSNTANSANTLSNACVYPFMVLGGLYFPVTDMPFPINLLVALNPVTYLINGLRDSLGVFPSPTSTVLNIIVPAIWIIITLGYALRNLRWEAKGGAR